MTSERDRAPGSGGDSGRRRILAIDTATRASVVAVGSDGAAIEGSSRRAAMHRHGTHLLEQVEEVLTTAGISMDEVSAIAVGTGPGSFTGMRVGLATAKTIAYARSLPLIGIASSDALRAAAGAAGAATDDTVVVLPAGARDHYLAAAGEDARLVPPGALHGAIAGRPMLSVDMDAELLGVEAADLGRSAMDGLAAALLDLAAARLAAGRTDDLERLVPAYVALPRGVAAAAEDLGWSPDLR